MGDLVQDDDIAARALLAQEVADIGTWDWDIDLGITNCSRTYFRLYGLPEARHAPSHDEWLALIHPEDRERVDADLSAALEDRKPYDTEFRVVWPDGTIRWLSGRGKVLYQQGRACRMLGVNMDITAHKIAAGLRHENELLLRSNTELQQFAARAAHDLQQPLRTARAFTELLLQKIEGRLTPAESEYRAFIEQGFERMTTLINELLTYARSGAIQPLHLEPVDIADCVRAATDNLAAAVVETGALIESAPLPSLRVQRTLIVTLIQNLLSNALNYRRPDEHPRIQITASREPDHTWLFAVSDNGRGFDPAQAEHIFQPLNRLQHSGVSGTGLGLATCRKIVDGHSGRIWAEGKPGIGATFYFTLPDTPS
jgi:PAS domain S-box-containing protein